MNQTERYDEIFRRGKGLLDFMDEVVKETKKGDQDWIMLPTQAQMDAIYRRYGNDLEAFFRDAHAEAKATANKPDPRAEHERLREAVIEAAKGLNRVVDPDLMFVNMRFDEELSIALDALYKATDELEDFERGIKEQS